MNYTMKKILVLSIFVCSIWFVLLTGIVPVYADDASIVRASRVDGNVTKNGVPLKEGDVIQRDEKIETKANSAFVLAWSNGSMVEMYSDTVLILKGVIFESDRKLEKSLLALEKGRVFVKAQVPEHLFCHFEISVGNVPVMTQGAEFAVKFEEAQKQITVWALLNGVIVDMGVNRVRVEEGQQADLKIGGKPESPVPMPEKTREALTKISKRLGGSLLVEEETVSVGGRCTCKIGGVKNRRGNAPYTVRFKAMTSGGSGKVKSIRWDFGDGENALGKEVQHTFTQGVYVIVLTVEDENGEKATAQVNISVEEQCGC